MNTNRQITPLLFLLTILFMAGCAPGQIAQPELPPGPTPTPTSTLILTSRAFKNGETIPQMYSYKLGGQCNGENYSPPLSIGASPANTQSFALIMVDPDAGNWVHWVQFNIPGTTKELDSAVGGPDLGIKGGNSFREIGYAGPCPPSGTHNYIITIYALDSLLSLSQGATKAEVEAAMRGHILQQAQLIGKFSH